jgi:hypothetical protein
MASYDYILKRYGFRPEIGRRVEHTITSRQGAILRERKSHGHYIAVRFDGDRHPSFSHPLELEFLDQEGDV